MPSSDFRFFFVSRGLTDFDLVPVGDDKIGNEGDGVEVRVKLLVEKIGEDNVRGDIESEGESGGDIVKDEAKDWVIGLNEEPWERVFDFEPT